MGGMSGAVDLIEKEFALSALAKGFVTGSLLIGCLIGALVGGSLSDKYGRKPMLIFSAILLGISGLGMAHHLSFRGRLRSGCSLRSDSFLHL